MNTKVIPFVEELPPTESVVCHVGQNQMNYRKGAKVAGVSIVGMRNRPLKLRRMQLERLQTFMAGARGLPQFYALQFDKRIIHVWPYCVRDMHFIIEYGDANETPDETLTENENASVKEGDVA